MKLQYSFTFLFVLKVIFSHPASSESGLQSENISGTGENSASDRIFLSNLDDSHTTTEKKSCDSEGTEIISCVKHFDSDNHEDFIEPFCSNSYQSAEDLTKGTENIINDNSTTEFQHTKTSATEAYVIANSSIVNMIDNVSTNLTTYEEYQDNTFVPSDSSYTSDLNAGDIQEDFYTGVHEATELEVESASLH